MKMPTKWLKLGRIFFANQHSDWMFSHGAWPIAEHLHGDLFRIYFTVRDKQNRSHGAFLELDIQHPKKIIYLHDKPVLEPGALGCFDDSGALLNCIVMLNGVKHAFYTGVNLGVTVPTRYAAGLVVWNAEKTRFDRCFLGPILDRTKNSPHFAAGPDVLYEQETYRMWFTCGKEWVLNNGLPKHYYNIEYAESKDAISWNRPGKSVIDFKNEHEYVICSPRVIKDKNQYNMWYSYRASQSAESYRIGYAVSRDGLSWERQDSRVGIEVSPSGWDSEMICYPFVFDHKEKRYLLYSGNHYGKSGFGLAVLV